jgi:predicted HTH domain antitoxin
MVCVNVRQLKDNPSEALRSAAKGPVLVLKGDRPEAVILHLDPGQAPGEADLRLALATALFKAGTLSLGRAARIADVGVADLVSHISRLGIPVVQDERAEAASDLETLEGWLASS